MQHLDPDRLVLLALSAYPKDAGEPEHLATCAGCRHDLESLHAVAVLGAGSRDLGDLPPPPERVWRAIRANIAQPAPVMPLAGRRSRTRPRRLMPMIAAAAAVVLAVAGTVAVDRFLNRTARRSLSAAAGTGL